MKQNIKTNPFKVGDIVFTIWGYSMTIVDFYQVVRVTPSKVELSGLEQEENPTGYLSGVTSPRKDHFYNDGGPYSVKPGQLCKVREDGLVVIPSHPGSGDHNLARLWDGRPRTYNHCD